MSELEFTVQQIYDYKIFKSNKTYVQKIFINVVRDLSLNCKETENGELSIKNFLFTLKSPPRCSEIEKYTIDHLESDTVYLDINKCSSIMTILNETNYVNKNKYFIDIHKSMMKLRDNRNKQEKCKCTEEELSSFKNEMIHEIQKICDFMQKSNIVTKKYANLRETNICGIEELWKAKIINESKQLTEVLNDLEKLRLFNSKCRAQLIEVYKKLLESSPLLEEKFKFNIEAIFVSPLLRDKTETIPYQTETIPYQDILKRKLKKHLSEVPVIIISGDAGHGKTTLCKKLTLDWCASDNPVFDYDLLLYIEVKRATEKGICQYLKEILLQDSLLEVNATDEEIVNFLQKLKLLVIIDAYDEKSNEASSLIDSLFEFLADKKIIITTRPYYTQRITKVLQSKSLDYLDLKLDGFEDETEYIRKVWIHLGEQDKDFKLKIENFLEFNETLPEDLKKLLKIPLITFLLIYLWINSKTAIKNLTFTSLYHQIFELQKETIKKKILQTEKKNPIAVIEQVIHNFFSRLSEKCYNYLIKTKIMNTNCIEEMKSYLTDELRSFHMKEEYNTLFFSTTFQTTRNLRNLKNENILQFEFLHKTQFEYFVACHAANVLSTMNASSVKSINDLEIFNTTNFRDNINEFSFLLGILNEKGTLEKFLNDIIKNLKDKVPDNYDIFWKLISETISKNETDSEYRPNDKLCRYFRTMLLKSDWRLRDCDVISGMNILRYTNFIPDKLIIDISGNPYAIPSFEHSFSMMVKCLNKLKGKMKFELRFDIHKIKSDDKNEDRSSDNILAYLVSGNVFSLETFTGHIDKDRSVKVLDISLDLIRIDVRVTSIPILQNIVEACKKNKKLKWVYFIFDEPFKTLRKGNSLPKLNVGNDKTNLCVVYNSVKDVRSAIYNLVEMKPEKRIFYSVRFELVGDQKRSPKDWLLNIQDKRLIMEKLTIRCLSYQMEDDEKIYLTNLLDYKLRWNE